MTTDNKTLCAIPFVGLMINTDSNIKYCCLAKGPAATIKKTNNAKFTCTDNFTQDAWNSEYMRNLRKNMIDGKKIDGCSTCYIQEQNGKFSNRQHAISEWKWKLGEPEYERRIEYAKNNDGKLIDDIVYLDLRLGNLCNLKCRMCNSWNSSQIYKEQEEIKKSDPEWSKIFGTKDQNIMTYQQYFDQDLLWDQVISLIPNLKKVYMTGGEPTLIKNNFKFMEKCIEKGRKDIMLFFNTNCTNINKTFLNLISQFDMIYINASIDGVNAVNNYIRSPSDWTLLKDNVEQLAQMKNVNLGITPTVQIYNIFDINNILEWVEELNARFKKKIFVDFLFNIDPTYLNVNILPINIKNAAIQQLEEYIEKFNFKHTMLTQNSVKSVLNFLKNDRLINADEELKKFKKYTIKLDEHRNQTFSVLDSRLHKLIYD